SAAPIPPFGDGPGRRAWCLAPFLWPQKAAHLQCLAQPPQCAASASGGTVPKYPMLGGEQIGEKTTRKWNFRFGEPQAHLGRRVRQLSVKGMGREEPPPVEMHSGAGEVLDANVVGRCVPSEHENRVGFGVLEAPVGVLPALGEMEIERQLPEL